MSDISPKTYKNASIVTFIASLAILIMLGRNFYLGYSSLKWEYADGEIIKSEIYESKKSNNSTRYIAQIKYSYVVNDVKYENSTVNFKNNKTYTYQFANYLIGKYKLNEEVKVYFNNDKPSLSTLERGYEVNFVILSFAFCLLVVSIFLYNKSKKAV